MAYPAQVAFSFFADVGGEEDRARRSAFSCEQRSGQAKQRGETRSVITGTGAEDALTVFAGSAIRIGREDCVQMCGKKDDGATVPRHLAGKKRKGIAGVIDMRIFEAKFSKPFEEPLSALLFRERRRRDGEHL